MSHPRPSLLHRYVLGEADGDERLIVERHAASCAACRAALAAERQLDELLVEGAAPADAGLDRAAFESVWARADAAPPVLVRTAPTWRAAAAAAVLLAAGAVAWWATRGSGAAHAPLLTADVPTPSQVVEPQPSIETPQTVAETPQVTAEPPPPLDPAEVARLQAVRDDLRRVLASAQRSSPDVRADFVAACEPTLTALRGENWPIERLVAGLVGDADADVAQAALRLAAGTREGQADVAACLRDEQRADAALAALEAAPDRPPASVTLAEALLARLQPAPDGGLGALEIRAAQLLASDAGPAARESLGRALDRALASVGLVSASDIERLDATRSRLFALAATAPVELVAQRTVAVVASADIAGELLARAAARDASACGEGLLRAVQTPRLDTARRLASLSTSRSVAAAMPALLAALDAHPDEPELLAAVSSLARTADVPFLASLHRAQRGRTRDRIEEAWLAALRRDPGLVEPTGMALASDVDAAVRLARALGANDAMLAGPRLLLAALTARPTGREGLEGTSTLLSALAAFGASDAGPPLLAWIDSRPDHDPCLPLAWTAAARLSPEPALSRWTRDVGDPQLLARAADGGRSWPEAAPSPPRRLLEPLRAALLDVSRDRHHAPAGSSGLKELR